MDSQEKVQYVNDIFTLNGHLQFGPDCKMYQKIEHSPQIPALVISMLIMHGFLQDFNSISDSTLFFSIIKNILQKESEMTQFRRIGWTETNAHGINDIILLYIDYNYYI